MAKTNSPMIWGITDTDAYQAWQGKRVLLQMSDGTMIDGDLVGYGAYTLTLKMAARVVVVNKGHVVVISALE